VSGSNQGSNNLTLKGWPLTVSNLFYFNVYFELDVTVSGKNLVFLNFF